MNGFFDKINAEQEPPALEAFFHQDVVDVDTLAQVIVPSFDYSHVWPDVPWMPRGEIMPSAGDRAVVIMTEERRPWVLAWWPS